MGVISSSANSRVIAPFITYYALRIYNAYFSKVGDIEYLCKPLKVG